jgi:hypothetical protein
MAASQRKRKKNAADADARHASVAASPRKRKSAAAVNQWVEVLSSLGGWVTVDVVSGAVGRPDEARGLHHEMIVSGTPLLVDLESREYVIFRVAH